MYSRRERWFVLSGASALSRQSQDAKGPKFCNYYKRGSTCEEDPEELELIQRDLGRVDDATFERLFGKLGPNRQTVMQSATRVLVAFSNRNRHLGYVQGHHNMCLLLLSEFLENNDQQLAYEEERAFWVFCALCETIVGVTFYALTPKLEGVLKSIDTMCKSVDEKKFESVKNVDRDGVIHLVALKWLLQLWADEDVVRDVEVVKRVWDCIFLSSAGCSSMCPTESALRNSFKERKTVLPRETDFHLRLAVCMIQDTPILSPILPENDTVKMVRPVAVSTLGGDADAKKARQARLRKTASSGSSERFLQQGSPQPMLRRKASLEGMGGHATGHVYDTIINRVRRLTPRKLEELILRAERIQLAKDSQPRRASVVEKTLDTAPCIDTRSQEDRDTESQGVIQYIKRLSTPNNCVKINYAEFKKLAQKACPDWQVGDITHFFTKLDAGRRGWVNSHYALQQFPGQFPDHNLQTLESLATAIYTFCASQLDQQRSQNVDTEDIYDKSESCTTGDKCILQ